MNQHDSPNFRTPRSFVTFRLARLQSSLNAQATAILREKGDISLVEWRLIQVLRMFGNASLTEIAERVQMDKGQLSRKITAMAKRGLLRVEKSSKDQRVQHLHLTEKAQDLSQKIMPVMEARQKLLLADVSPDDLATFYDVVEKIDAASKVRDIG